MATDEFLALFHKALKLNLHVVLRNGVDEDHLDVGDLFYEDRHGGLHLLTQAKLEEMQQQDAAAQKKGMKLLMDNLNPEQLAEFRRYGYFEAKGSVTGKWYRIAVGKQANVWRLDSRRGNPEQGICFTIHKTRVRGDCMLAQKIAIENFEREIYKVYNPFRVDNCPL